MKGLRKRPTYNELIEQAENSDDIIKKYPDRRATFMRNHPYLTTLDGENFMEALNMQQNNMIRSQQKDLLLREYATQTDDMSHLEVKAKETQDAFTSTKAIKTKEIGVGISTQIKTKDIGVGKGRINSERILRNMGTNTDEPVQKSSSSTSPMTIKKLNGQTQTPPMVATPLHNRYQIFDMAADDTVLEEAEEAVQEQLEDYRQRETVNAARINEESQRMFQGMQSQNSASVIQPRRLDFMDPMTVNSEGGQHKREAETPPTSSKKKKGSKSELLEIGDNPEAAHEPKGPVGRPKVSAKSSSSSSSSSSSAAAAPAASSSSASAGSQQVPIKKAIDKSHGVKKDTHTGRNYWKNQNIQYLYEQLQLDGQRFTVMDKTGKEDVFDPVLGRKVQKKGKKLTKDDLLDMLYKSRNI